VRIEAALLAAWAMVGGTTRRRGELLNVKSPPRG
jgi:hypothetical protein